MTPNSLISEKRFRQSIFHMEVGPLSTCRSAPMLMRRDYERAKRMLDVAICLLFSPVVALLMGCCALLIWLEDGGPILFKQQRTGRGGRRFGMYKFRTMVADAEALKEELRHLNELSWPDFKITDDPRVTKVGRFLRKTSLDELPQLLNVLRGEMSLVGPRPTSFASSTYALWQTERLEVTPGVTGLWQVSGRSDLDFDDRLKLDLQYIEQRSTWMDLKILARTVFAVCSRRGAY